MTIQAAQHLGQFERARTSIIGLGFPLPPGLAMNPLFTLDQMSATRPIQTLCFLSTSSDSSAPVPRYQSLVHRLANGWIFRAFLCKNEAVNLYSKSKACKAVGYSSDSMLSDEE